MSHSTIFISSMFANSIVYQSNKSTFFIFFVTVFSGELPVCVKVIFSNASSKFTFLVFFVVFKCETITCDHFFMLKTSLETVR